MPLQDWQAASLEGAAQAYLMLLDEDDHQIPIGAGGGTCWSPVCVDNVSVWLCNDPPYPQTMTSTWLAAHVGFIIQYCTFGPGLTGGQAFDINGMNVIVKQEENCDSPKSPFKA